MQAVALVTGDEFLVSFNLTIDAEDVRDYIASLGYDWHENRHYTVVNFDDQFGIDYAPIPGPSGLCYNFNMIKAEELFKQE